jgi:hypothetical protein
MYGVSKNVVDSSHRYDRATVQHCQATGEPPNLANLAADREHRKPTVPLHLRQVAQDGAPHRSVNASGCLIRH